MYTTSQLLPAIRKEILKVVMDSPTKSSQLDPIPTVLLKQCITTLNPAIHHIVNLSLRTGHVPHAIKSAVITPLLKKLSLEPILRNYWPVSNLAFLSKVLERVVAAQIKKYLDDNNPCDTFQSAYSAGHSAKTGDRVAEWSTALTSAHVPRMDQEDPGSNPTYAKHV